MLPHPVLPSPIPSNIPPIFLSIATHLVPTMSISLGRSLLTCLPATLPDTCHCHPAPAPPQSNDLEEETSLGLRLRNACQWLAMVLESDPHAPRLPLESRRSGRALSTLGRAPPNAHLCAAEHSGTRVLPAGPQHVLSPRPWRLGTQVLTGSPPSSPWRLCLPVPPQRNLF